MTERVTPPEEPPARSKRRDASDLAWTLMGLMGFAWMVGYAASFVADWVTQESGRWSWELERGIGGNRDHYDLAFEGVSYLPLVVAALAVGVAAVKLASRRRLTALIFATIAVLLPSTYGIAVDVFIVRSGAWYSWQDPTWHMLVDAIGLALAFLAAVIGGYAVLPAADEPVDDELTEPRAPPAAQPGR